MKKILFLISLLIFNNSFAEYTAKVPLEVNNGGSLPNGSLNIGNLTGNGNENGSGDSCFGRIQTQTRQYQTSGTMIYTILFEEVDEDVNGILYESSSNINGFYSPLVTSSYRYSIGDIENQDQQVYNSITEYIPEGDYLHVKIL